MNPSHANKTSQCAMQWVLTKTRTSCLKHVVNPQWQSILKVAPFVAKLSSFRCNVHVHELIFNILSHLKSKLGLYITNITLFAHSYGTRLRGPFFWFCFVFFVLYCFCAFPCDEYYFIFVFLSICKINFQLNVPSSLLTMDTNGGLAQS